jgi:DNA transformation protein
LKALRSHRKPRARGLKSLRGSPSFRSYVLDQLQELDGVSARSMFGGTGLYQHDVFFGIIARDVLYLKVDDTNRAEFIAAGSEPFQPYPDRAGTMQYYAVPLGVLESAAELTAWARKSVAVGRRTPRRTKVLKS